MTLIPRIDQQILEASPLPSRNGFAFAAQRVAMRQGSNVTCLHFDYLSGSNVTTDASGNDAKRQTYFPFGAPRATTRSVPAGFGFTWQKFAA